VVFPVAVDVEVEGLEVVSGFGVVVSGLGVVVSVLDEERSDAVAAVVVAVVELFTELSLISVSETAADDVVYVFFATANDLEIYLATLFSSSNPI